LGDTAGNILASLSHKMLSCYYVYATMYMLLLLACNHSHTASHILRVTVCVIPHGSNAWTHLAMYSIVSVCITLSRESYWYSVVHSLDRVERACLRGVQLTRKLRNLTQRHSSILRTCGTKKASLLRHLIEVGYYTQ